MPTPSPSDSLAISNIAIYALLAIPITYTLVRHGAQGLMGWGYLLGFCVLRMTGNGLQLSEPSSSTVQIITGIGLSPLLLALLGVLHESSSYISGEKPWLLRRLFYIITHGIVGFAVVLLVLGGTSSSSSSSSSSSAGGISGSALSKIGALVFLLVCIILAGQCALSWRYPKHGKDARLLLLAVTVSLPFLAIRTIYTVASSFDESINMYTGPIVYRVVLGALMEYIVAIDMIAFGIITRNIRRDKKLVTEKGVPLQQRGHYGPVVLSVI